MPGGGSTIEHHHIVAEKIYLITHGCGRLRVGDDERDVVAGDCIVIPPRTLHKLWNTAAEPLVLLCCCFAEGLPNWKSARSVLVGLYPTVVLLTLGISEIWPDGKLWETLLLGNILSVSLLTWVVMPIVTWSLRFWLVPDPRRDGEHLDWIGAAASIGFLALAALIFWLATTQIWTLP